MSETAGIPVTGAATGVRTVPPGPALVILGGIATTILSLLGVWWLDNNTTDFHVMGWYGDYVIPAGALLVGLAAGSGYGIASYLTGYRIRRGLLIGVVALQLAGYAGAQFLEFRSLTREGPLLDEQGEELTFARYYHLRAVTFAFEDHGRPGKPLGQWGYAFVALGVLGFALGGVIAPAVLMKVPYCERCALYMQTRTLALAPAAEGDALLARLAELSGKGDAPGIRSALAGHPPRGADARRTNKLPARLRLALVRCRRCSGGHLQPAVVTGRGRGIRVQQLAKLPLSSETARQVAT